MLEKQFIKLKNSEVILLIISLFSYFYSKLFTYIRSYHWFGLIYFSLTSTHHEVSFLASFFTRITKIRFLNLKVVTMA